MLCSKKIMTDNYHFLCAVIEDLVKATFLFNLHISFVFLFARFSYFISAD